MIGFFFGIFSTSFFCLFFFPSSWVNIFFLPGHGALLPSVDLSLGQVDDDVGPNLFEAAFALWLCLSADGQPGMKEEEGEEGAVEGRGRGRRGRWGEEGRPVGPTLFEAAFAFWGCLSAHSESGMKEEEEEEERGRGKRKRKRKKRKKE
jgi:hypothetical protein